jgi:hypothetical protein
MVAEFAVSAPGRIGARKRLPKPRPIPVARLIGLSLRLGALERIDQPQARQRQQILNVVQRPPEKDHAAPGYRRGVAKSLTASGGLAATG